MKKFILLMLAILMCLSICACGQEDTSSDTQQTTQTEQTDPEELARYRAEVQLASWIYSMYGDNDYAVADKTRYSITSIQKSQYGYYEVYGKYSTYDKYDEYLYTNKFCVKVYDDGTAKIEVDY